ncbi:helix-turn-helix domain-containing protein [Pelosinus propionicus]|uniref:AraC-type DNA-binding protein n=1 Tax=Pelosinus propionicus DSM 13327 TaxID=1123291 RepID=A0A1I4IGL8_9FIRM|nr:AraC family transcriptional regulator [Pelosinus propionicus]SFL53522.1 AraC-type DNA-binding protein [Pelosinus propionicus DSM 13327]
MKVNIDDMADGFSRISFDIIDAGRFAIEPGRKCVATYTAAASGIIFPLRGKARMTFEGVTYEMEPGRFFHAGPKMTLDKEVLGESTWEFVLIHYKIPESEKCTFPYALSHYELNSGYSPRINDMLQRLCHTLRMPSNLQALRAKSLFLSFMDEVLTCSTNREKESGRSLVEQSIEYMDNHYMEQLTIPKLAGQYGLSSKQFAYLFQKHTKMSPNEYLISQRMKRAKELLCTTTCSVSEISDYVGYSDSYYFSKLFKKRTGASPSTLRNFFEKNTG